MMSALRLLLVPAIAFVSAFLAPDIAAVAQAGAAKPNRIKIDYVAPKNPAHQVIYRKLKEIRALENLREFLSAFRLPRTLLVKTEGCDGESNAWYEDGAITICYECIEEIWRTAPSETTADGITPVDALFGPVTDTALHEFGHAIFEIYKLPVFGHEETRPIRWRPTSSYNLARTRHAGFPRWCRLRLFHEDESRDENAQAGAVRKRARHARATPVQCHVHRLRRRPKTIR